MRKRTESVPLVLGTGLNDNQARNKHRFERQHALYDTLSGYFHVHVSPARGRSKNGIQIGIRSARSAALQRQLAATFARV